MKEKVSKEVGDARGKVKLLLATEAYGMGADCSNIRRVIHIGPPNSLEGIYLSIKWVSKACLFRIH